MAWLGYEIRVRSLCISFKTAAMLAVTGLFIHFAEAAWLAGHEVRFNNHDFLLDTPIWAVGLFFLLLNKPALGDHPAIFKLADMTLSIYIAYLPILIIFYNLADSYALQSYTKDFLLVGGTLTATLVLITLLRRTARQRLLLR
jgi:surface polysaccharide O-acyltransferase-like enzyme